MATSHMTAWISNISKYSTYTSMSSYYNIHSTDDMNDIRLTYFVGTQISTLKPHECENQFIQWSASIFVVIVYYIWYLLWNRFAVIALWYDCNHMLEISQRSLSLLVMWLSLYMFRLIYSNRSDLLAPHRNDFTRSFNCLLFL